MWTYFETPGGGELPMDVGKISADVSYGALLLKVAAPCMAASLKRQAFALFWANVFIVALLTLMQDDGELCPWRKDTGELFCSECWSCVVDK